MRERERERERDEQNNKTNENYLCYYFLFNFSQIFFDLMISSGVKVLLFRNLFEIVSRVDV